MSVHLGEMKTIHVTSNQVSSGDGSGFAARRLRSAYLSAFISGSSNPILQGLRMGQGTASSSLVEANVNTHIPFTDALARNPTDDRNTLFISIRNNTRGNAVGRMTNRDIFKRIVALHVYSAFT
ncbi:hypothetical protein Bbelb_002570 [Branchiostoma belcheri]|nr:hypothetical protein Bbelb_002570 [Branchiostoma belcheri]